MMVTISRWRGPSLIDQRQTPEKRKPDYPGRLRRSQSGWPGGREDCFCAAGTARRIPLQTSLPGRHRIRSTQRCSRIACADSHRTAELAGACFFGRAGEKCERSSSFRAFPRHDWKLLGLTPDEASERSIHGQCELRWSILTALPSSLFSLPVHPERHRRSGDRRDRWRSRPLLRSGY